MIAKLAHDLYAGRPADRLYHHTSLTGAKGIVDTAFLRATGIRYFSDAVELIYTGQQLESQSWFREGFGQSNPRLFNQLRQWLSHRLSALRQKPLMITGAIQRVEGQMANLGDPVGSERGRGHAPDLAEWGRI